MKKQPLPAAAPDMGDYQNGIAAFKAIKPPYVRGGGTPATQLLENACLKHLAPWVVHPAGIPSPSISIVSSGQAANHVVFKALHGGDMVSSTHLFGTTKVDLKKTYMRAGGNIAWVDPCNTKSFINSTTPKTTAWFAEAISNPAGRVPDLEELSKAAKERSILLILDSTLAAGMGGFNGLKYADVLTVSLTKQSGGGQNQNTGGAVIVSNQFDWAAHGSRFPEFEEYFEKNRDGVIQLPTSPFAALTSKISLHEGSGVISPRDAVSIAQSLPGMQQRVNKMCRNAKFLADILIDHPAVNSVQLAGHHTDAENDRRAQKFLGGNHFVLLVDLKDGSQAAEKFINSRQFSHAVALGQRMTAVSHPSSSTHRQYSKDDLAGMGIYGGTLRISVGTEPRRELGQKILLALS